MNSCYLCPEEAVGRCYTCGQLFCTKHGDVNCSRCANGIVEGDPRPDRVSTRILGNGARSGWWRPQEAEDYEPPACYHCHGLARTVCRHCASFYCPEHAGSSGLCASCSRSSFMGLLILIGIVLLLAGLMVAGWVRGWN